MLDGRDQAEGLRRMLAAGRTRSIAVFGARPGCGATSVAVNLGAALTAAGRSVLLVDEHFGPGNAAGLLGIHTRLDLRHALSGDSSLAAVVHGRPSGLMLLPAASGARALGRMSTAARGQAVAGLGLSDGWCDIVLVDALAPAAGRPALFGAAAQEALIVLQADPVSITQAYAVMKRLRREHGIDRFRALVNRAVNRGMADRAAANLTHAARGFLDATLDYAGAIPQDEAFAAAAVRAEPMVECDPAAPATVALQALARAALSWPAARRGADGPANLFRKFTYQGAARRAAAGG
jgi:flagellar biosynthesis protein FlhG